MCVYDSHLGFEDRLAHRNLYQRERVLRKRVQHIQITTLQAEFAYACGDAHLGLRFEQFGVSDKRVTWIPPPLLFAHPYPPRIEVLAIYGALVRRYQ